MTESQNQHEAYYGFIQDFISDYDKKPTVFEAWQHQQQRIDDQLLTIKALNECINGKDSLTTDNLTLVGRLEQRVEELESKLKIAVDALNNIANDTRKHLPEKYAREQAIEALKQIEVK